MGIIFDTITELAKLNKQSLDGAWLKAIEIAGVYYVYDKNFEHKEYKSLREIDGSEEWTTSKASVVGLSDDPDYQTMTMYYDDQAAVSADNKVAEVYPHEVKTVSGRIVHLAS